ncbi:Uncharacterised protein [Serratia quinivorans]|nr:Uncharacterised protein [Serratia quinivorans]
MKLTEYIEKYFNGNKSEFARSEGVNQSQVHQWIGKDFIVVDGVMYSPRRDLKPRELK